MLMDNFSKISCISSDRPSEASFSYCRGLTRLRDCFSPFRGLISFSVVTQSATSESPFAVFIVAITYNTLSNLK
jgi:hypothetical protein